MNPWICISLTCIVITRVKHIYVSVWFIALREVHNYNILYMWSPQLLSKMFSSRGVGVGISSVGWSLDGHWIAAIQWFKDDNWRVIKESRRVTWYYTKSDSWRRITWFKGKSQEVNSRIIIVGICGWSAPRAE